MPPESSNFPGRSNYQRFFVGISMKEASCFCGWLVLEGTSYSKYQLCSGYHVNLVITQNRDWYVAWKTDRFPNNAGIRFWSSIFSWGVEDRSLHRFVLATERDPKATEQRPVFTWLLQGLSAKSASLFVS